ncbi:MAG: trypsin-like peptidase domain-containing protein [Actinomycetota bacterium]|nr:trypsin-like peptidase domain-containing protein [Actinomycetota bacterium]
MARGRLSDSTLAFGTGYRVRTDLVLTAEHVVPLSPDGEPRVVVWCKGEAAVDGDVVWRGRDALHLDLALVRIPSGTTWPPVGGAAWGSLDRESPLGQVSFRFLGYPRANEIDEEWNRDDRSGHIPLQTFAESDLFACDVWGPGVSRITGQTYWAGASGSAVFADGLLVAVVIEDPVRVEPTRLIAVPVRRALLDRSFAARVGVNPDAPVAVRPVQDPAEKPIELAAWIDDTVDVTWAAGLKQAFEANQIGVRFVEGDLPEAELLRWNRLAPSADRYLSVMTRAGSRQASQMYSSARQLVGQRRDLLLAVLAPEGVSLDRIESRHVARYGDAGDIQAAASTVAVQLAAARHTGRAERATVGRRPRVHRGYNWLGNFVGRHDERRQLLEWLPSDGEALYVVQAMGGTGKSALAWVWLMGDVLGELTGEDTISPMPESPASFDGVAWFSFYGKDSTSSHFFEWLLREFDVGSGTDDRAGLALDLLRNQRLLVVMDGLERELRAYHSLAAGRLGERIGPGENDFEARSAVDPALTRFLQGLTDPTIDSKVLVTTRLLPSELDDPAGILGGFRHMQLGDFRPEDVVKLYRNFHIKGTDAEIIAACRPYGFHPLTVRLLAGMIVKSPRDPGHIRVAPRYDPLRVSELRTKLMADSYDSLFPAEVQVLGRLSACRGGVRFRFAHRISGIDSEVAFEEALAGLISRGLVMSEPDASRFDLHPIVRHYAYGRLVDRQGLHQAIAEELEEDLEDVDLEDEELALEEFLNRKDELLEFFYQLVSLGELEDGVSLFISGLQHCLERAGQFEDAVACLDLLLDDGSRLDEELDDPDYRFMLRTAQAGLAIRLGLPDVALLHVDAESEHPSWSDEALPGSVFVGQVAGCAILDQIRATALWFLGRVTEAKDVLERALGAIGQDDDHRQLGIELATLLANYRLGDGELVAYRDLNQRIVEWVNATIDEALAMFDNDAEVPIHVRSMQTAVSVQEACLKLLPERDIAELRLEDLRKFAELLATMRGPIAELLEIPVLAADVRQTLELQLVMMQLNELQLGTTMSAKQLATMEEQLREFLLRARGLKLVLHEVCVLNALALTLLEAGNLAAAAQRAEEAVSISDARRICVGSVAGRVVLARCEIRNGNDVEAEAWESEARRLATSDGERHFALLFEGLRWAKDEARAKRSAPL